ncbi:class I SAM-dependent methyltransferase [Aeribacillus pallidus]|jgi:putative AdoMet-dependent methyltransferase|uniref:class I SAM-dependent methyltransferase n=1 Tax=Aeribacillus pallidus TaxID=33936 RepID=UPI001D1F9E87|nr:methyltransferase domain-containing protein [Bacillus sp. (in: firmicutes)]
MGREFLDIFQQWAESYDETVSGHDLEYEKVFEHYEDILTKTADRSFGTVLEFGPGTGNLTLKLIERQRKVIAVEPSLAMRKKAEKKLQGKAILLDGDFLSFEVNEHIDSIVSTYAFHHLTDEEKAKAFELYGKMLAKGGKIVFADTMFESKEAYEETIQQALANGFHNLAEDLHREYYTTHEVLRLLAEQNGFSVTFERCNDFVWLMEAVKR